LTSILCRFWNFPGSLVLLVFHFLSQLPIIHLNSQIFSFRVCEIVVSGQHRTWSEDVTDPSVMGGHLSVGDRWRIISLSLDQGMTSSEIASIIHCTSRTVRNILRLYCETNNVTEREGRGRTLLNNRRRIQDNITVDRMIEDILIVHKSSSQ